MKEMTVREARINVALHAIVKEKMRHTDSTTPNVDLATVVVDALFPPDPHIDNLSVPAKACRECGSEVIKDGVCQFCGEGGGKYGPSPAWEPK